MLTPLVGPTTFGYVRLDMIFMNIMKLIKMKRLFF